MTAATTGLPLTALLAAFLVSSCDSGSLESDKLYSRSLVISNVRNAEITEFIRNVANATGTSEKDSDKDLDGNHMFLYSSDKVVVFVMRELNSSCNDDLCTWEVGISPFDTNADADVQKTVVDQASNSLTDIPYIADRLGESR